MHDMATVKAKAAGLLVLLCLVSAGMAWACVPQARLVSLQPRSSGKAGSQVTVSGLGFDPGRAEIRWNDADGPLLGTASGPNFSVQVTIPEAPEGLYAIVVLSRAATGGVGNAGRAAFQIASDHRNSSARTVDGSDRPRATTPSAGASVDGVRLPVTGLILGGAALLALGGLTGTLAAGRRRRQ